MSAETERSVNGMADLRKDMGGDYRSSKSSSSCKAPVPESSSSCDCIGNTSSCGPGITPKPLDNDDCLRDDLQKTSILSAESSACGSDGRKASLPRTNSDTSYSSMEADFLMTSTRNASGASSQNLELNAMDTSASKQALIQPSAEQGHSKPELMGGVVEEILVPESMQIKSECSAVIGGDSTAVAAVAAATGDSAENKEDGRPVVMGLEDQGRLAMSVMRKIKSDRGLSGAAASSEKPDEVSFYFSEPRADSAENLVLISESGENRARAQAGSFDLPKDYQSDVHNIPRSWSTPVAVTLCDKVEVRTVSQSLDPAEANDRTRSAENGSCLQSGSSTESGVMVVAPGDGIDRAKEILSHTSDIYETPVKEPSPKVGLKSLDGSKGAGDVGVNGSGGKVAKSSSDKKKRGLSWYSVLSPTYKSRSDDFKRIFKDIPSSERLIVDYSCALQKDILVHGRLYISQSWICFYANIFRWETILTIRCKDVVKLSKERTARVIPNAIQICTKDDKYFFTSFGTRDKTYLMLDRVWKNGVADETMSRRELWQWVHYSYGEELGLTSGDEDYITLSAEEKINFQTRIQKEESKLQKLSQRGDTSTTADSIKEPSVDYMAVNGDMQPSVEDIDSSVADNISVTSADDSIYTFSEGANLTESPADISHSSIPNSAPVSNCQEGVVVGDMSSEVEEDEEDSTGDEDVDRCADHAHFGIDVVDETFNIPIDTLFEHCFTDSPLYKEFVKNKKTFDVVLSAWPEEPDANGVKVRNIAYTLSLGYSIGPKYSPSTERQIMYPETRPGHFYLIDTECINGGIPYGENFYIVNRYCISKVSSTKCRLRITSELRYRKSVWGFVRNFIDKNATAGIIESFSVLAVLLRQESDRQAQLSNGQTSAAGRRKYLRRRRPVDRSPAKLPLADIQHPNVSKQSTPIKHFTPKASSVKVKEDWHVKLTVDILVRIVCAVLILLMIFNAILFYKLWSLEATAANVLLTQKPTRFSHRDPDHAESDEDWASLLNKQRVLHNSEINHWKDILSTSIQLMDEMIQALTDLRSNIDRRSLYTKDDQEMEASKIT